MRRGLLIFLAVALCAWFAPNAGALTRTPAVPASHYDEAVAVVLVALGDGITLDTAPGSKNNPVSLHRYLYCQDNPANYTDPTGHEVEEQLEVAFIDAKYLTGARSIANLLAWSTPLLFLQGDDQSDIPTMYYSKSKCHTIAPKIEALQLTHPTWSLLHYIGSDEETWFGTVQRRAALKKVKNLDPREGNSWDEYPFASTFEGGEPADVQATPEEEQSRQGGKHSRFYQDNHMLMGDPFFVKVIP